MGPPVLSLVSLFPGGSAPSVRLIRGGRRGCDSRTCGAAALPCPGLAGAGGASLNARIPPCLPPRAGGYKRVKKLGWRDEWRGAGRGRAAPRRARWKAEREDRGCGLGFESQPRRHCSRAPSRGEQRSGAELGSPCMYTGMRGAGGGRRADSGVAGGGASCPVQPCPVLQPRGPVRPPRLRQPPFPGAERRDRPRYQGGVRGGCGRSGSGELGQPAREEPRRLRGECGAVPLGKWPSGAGRGRAAGWRHRGTMPG